MKWPAWCWGIVGFYVLTLSASGQDAIRYVAIGDSYSIGEGAQRREAWPSLLAQHLTESGVAVDLVANPSVTGWTTADALEREMPVYIAARPTFATLQIGVNDWVQGVSAEQFRRKLNQLLDEMQAVLPEKKNLLLVNIPDFSVTPTGGAYGRGRNISRGLAEFNAIIAQEGAKRGLQVADIFALSQRMAENRSLIARDGLHPSAKEYAEWEKVIFPVARKLLAP